MNVLVSIWQDLRARKLVPVAAGLLVAIVAVPIVLSNSSGAPAPAAPALPPVAAANGLPAVSQTQSPSGSAPTGRSRDPFAPSSGAVGPSTSTTAATPVTTPGASTGGSSSGTQGSSPTGGAIPPTGPSTGIPTPTTIPTPKPRPTTHTLSADQSYAVSLAITNSRGGVNTLAPLERLSPLPSAAQPLLVELGVLKGGSRVLFAVQPGTVVSGKGTCVPGPIDCEILSLAQEQTEKLSVHSARGTVEVALFAVTAIRAVNHSSRAAAQRARHQESRAGRRVLGHSSLTALSLFHYSPGAGAVLDLRNLILRDS
jgi:hypothetical protein